jgi:hypothetical protein
VRRVLRAFLLIMVGYLCQVCIMPYLAIGSITPNLLFSLIAIVTVAYGRFYTFGVACMAGIIMEAMMGGLPNLYLIAYPAIGQLGSLIFADKSERKLEQERSQGKPGTNSDPKLRTLLCALFDIAWFEMVHILFIYLNGVDLQWYNFGRAAGSIAYTTAITALTMLPTRWLLGMYSRKTGAQAAV